METKNHSEYIDISTKTSIETAQRVCQMCEIPIPMSNECRRIRNCKHLFCLNCCKFMESYAKRKNLCPICKK